MSKRFPFTKRAIEVSEAQYSDSPAVNPVVRNNRKCHRYDPWLY